MSEPSDETTATTTADIDPAPPEEYVKAAKVAPDHWLYFVDPTWQGEELPPDWAVVGQWRSDHEGEIVEWRDNEAYQPSPSAHGWPEPVDAVDDAIQLASTGYGPAEDVPRTLAAAKLAVLVDRDGAPVSAATPDGTPVVPVFSSPVLLHRYGHLAFELVPTADLLDRLPAGHSLNVNPSATVSMVVDTEALREAVAEAEQAVEETPSAATRVATEGSSHTEAAMETWSLPDVDVTGGATAESGEEVTASRNEPAMSADSWDVARGMESR